MRIHTGRFVTMVTGRDFVHYSKQKLNSKSSTEAELVGVDDVLTQVMWNQYFLKEQVYMIHNNFIYKYNHSTINLENNGRRSKSKRTSQINIRYH